MSGGPHCPKKISYRGSPVSPLSTLLRGGSIPDPGWVGSGQTTPPWGGGALKRSLYLNPSPEDGASLLISPLHGPEAAGAGVRAADHGCLPPPLRAGPRALLTAEGIPPLTPEQEGGGRALDTPAFFSE